MITINLIPIKEKKRRKNLMIGFGVAACISIVLMGMGWYLWGKIRTVRALEEEIKRVEEESKAYEDKIKEVKDLQAKEARLDSLKKTMAGIAETQRKMAVAVDQFALKLPDGVWLTALTQGDGADTNKFTVTGYAFTQAGLEAYYDGIRKPGGYLKDASLVIRNIAASVGQNRQIYQFEISARVKDPGT